ncbi:pilus assembly protein TadG-related protein [Roseibium salinum]|nr:pilus assembly protein TadG-related protein [Roseibium salinum]
MNKSQFNRLRSLFRDLVQDKSASILPLFGLTVVLLVVMGGLAVDISRAVSAREKALLRARCRGSFTGRGTVVFSDDG